MKRKVLALLLVLGLAAALMFSCNLKPGESDGSKNTAQLLKEFTDLAAASDRTLTEATIDTTVTSGLGELKGHYAVTYTGEDSATVTYSYEQFNDLETARETQQVKSTTSGTVTYSGGVYSGTLSGGVSAAVAKKLSFTKEKLSDLVIDGYTLTAKVAAADTAEVLGTAIGADVQITIVRNATMISAMTFVYTQDGAGVTLTCGYR